MSLRISLALCVLFARTATAGYLTLDAPPDPVEAHAEAHEAGAQSSQNDANNPLTPKITINFQDYYIPRLEGLDEDANQFLFRGLVPHQLFGLPQLLRFTVPLATNPVGEDDHTSGIGDITLIDFVIIPKKPFEFGIGPLLIIPVGQDGVSAEKWQIGVAGVAIAPQRWGIAGAIVTFQQSIAGESDRDDVTLVTAQPLVIYNLPEGFYLRSSAVWNFDLNNDTYYIPVGIGAGKVWEFGKTTVNAFVEPQYTVFEDSDAAPRWQIFFGVNFQFALR